ncbi:MAG: hypothetical protein M1358_15060 [Chloroflexi bacterium]|nr:hypothetical protein [Chloroflexota bacterium]
MNEREEDRDQDSESSPNTAGLEGDEEAPESLDQGAGVNIARARLIITLIAIGAFFLLAAMVLVVLVVILVK